MIPPAWFLIAVAIMTAMALLLPGPAWIGSPERFLGVVVIAVGLAMVGLSIPSFVRLRTPIHPDHTPNALIRTGMYRFTRNPIYLGMTIALLGIAVVLGVAKPLPVPFLFAFVVGRLFIRREEANLHAEFGKAYDDYRARVRRWI
ncbi:MAG: isoprenylcysteine carboxylmethyltransferase family protein [Phycisphaeraceae bacterium]|nr:isoprenylcysteine carboxylmethyltransferase family protein [Phycisphaeraceae bacterium]